MGKLIDMASRRARMNALKAATGPRVASQPRPLAPPMGEVIQGFLRGLNTPKPVSPAKSVARPGTPTTAGGRPVLRGPGSVAPVRKPPVPPARFYARLPPQQLAGELHSLQEVRAGLAQRIREGGLTKENRALGAEYIRLNTALSMELRRRGLTPRDLDAIGRAAAQRNFPRRKVA